MAAAHHAILHAMFHPFPGFSGTILAMLSFGTIFLASYCTHGSGSFELDPPGKPGAYEPFLAKYLRIAEFVIGLATGSIVLLVGSSALHGQGRAPAVVLCNSAPASKRVRILWGGLHGLARLRL